jgi:hypothetical protein
MNSALSNYSTATMDILGKRFGFRNLLKNTQYHNYDGPISADELTEEKEPEIR